MVSLPMIGEQNSSAIEVAGAEQFLQFVQRKKDLTEFTAECMRGEGLRNKNSDVFLCPNQLVTKDVCVFRQAESNRFRTEKRKAWWFM